MRRTRLVAVIASIAVLTAVAMVVGLLVLDLGDGRQGRGEDVPGWVRVQGLIISGLGLVLLLGGGILLIRRLRGNLGWRSPLNVLTLRQRRVLVAELRGRARLVPEHVPLIRVLAETMLAQRVALVAQGGMVLSLLGRWIADRSPWWLVLGGLLAVVVLAAAAVVGRPDVTRARRFLEQHPGPEESRT